jgi:hypothetical protein
VVAALIGLGTWLWTPLRVWYWEREIRRTSQWGVLCGGSMGYVWYTGETVDAGKRLVSIGPRAAPAVSRLIREPAIRGPVLQCIGDARAEWAMPILANACQSEEGAGAKILIVMTAQTVSGMNFGAWLGQGDPERGETLRRFLDWWEREGQAKYGEGGK